MGDPNVEYGRLLEQMHFVGYSMGRAFITLKSLLAEDKWKTVGEGFDDIDKFTRSLNFSQFNILVEERRDIVKLLSEKRATQRAIADALGVTKSQINRDLNPVPNGTKQPEKPANKDDPVPNGTNPILSKSVEPERKPDKAAAIISMGGEDVTEKLEQKSTGNFHISDGENDWYTPPEIIALVREVMGSIDCDPASSDAAQKTIGATTYFTKETNGLEQPWTGNVFLNPPYSHPETTNFINRAITVIGKRECTQIICLTNNATDTTWFHALLHASKIICLPKTRLKFYNSNAETLGARQGQVLFYWGDESQKFIDQFSTIGACLKVI